MGLENATIMILLVVIGDSISFAQGEFMVGAGLRDDATRAQPHFRRAAELWEADRFRTNDGPNLELVIGDARFLSGDVARAIAAYRRGLCLVPGHARMRSSLELARSQVAIPADAEAALRPEPLPSRLRGYLWPNFTLFLFLFGYSGLWLGLGGWWMFHRRVCVVFAAAGLLVALLLPTSFLLAEIERRRDQNSPPLVLLRDTVLRQGNGDDYSPRLGVTLPMGLEARELAKRSGWVQIQLASGPIGWVPAENILRVFGATDS